MSPFENEKYSLTFGYVLLFLGFPLLLSGQFLWGGLFVLLALARRASEFTTASDKLQTHFDSLSPEEVIAELNQLAGASIDCNVAKRSKSRDTYIANEEIRIKYYVKGLSVLGRKYDESNRKEELSLPYQQLGFTLIRLHPQNDQILAGSVSLLTLVAKDAKVRERFMYQDDDYGLDRPIAVLKKVLERAKEEEDETKEAVLAEILRKGCLFLGAICSDGENLGLPSTIVSEGGLALILEAANWFRLHEDLSNWALWAIFTLCYDNLRIKAELIRSQGIQVTCTVMENNPTSLGVNRHGIALLFDLLRGNHGENDCLWDACEVRKIALASRLHELIHAAMNEFSDSIEVMMMGKEILIGTDYRGNIPEYKKI